MWKFAVINLTMIFSQIILRCPMQYKTFKLNPFFFIPTLFLIFFTTLITQAAPAIQIIAPTNGTTYVEGDTVHIVSNAANPGGSIAFVEFYVNNVYIGKDSTAPYQFNWISKEGTHLLTTKAVVGLCKDVISVPVQIVVKKNNPPAVQLTDPVSSNLYFSNIYVPLAATASDSDGVINHVDFYVNAVLVAKDETPPYQFNWKSIPGDFTVVATAVDNKGAHTTSVPVAITVEPPLNGPPTVTITSPVDRDHFILGTPINITANATDNSWVAFVEFFADNVSIGIDDTAPYEINWPGSAGVHTITAKATDDLCATVTSMPVHISVIDPNSPPYILQNISGPCTDPTFCLPLTAVLPVKDIIGYDMIVHYDKTKVIPTGKITINDDLIHAGFVSYVVNPVDSLGQLNLSVFLNNSAPNATYFKGIGNVLCIEFSKKTAFGAKDSALFSITDFQESYVNDVASKQVTPGKYVNLKNTTYKGLLQFWLNNSPISYDNTSPSHYLITNIFGTDPNCSNPSGNAVQPDLNGKFIHNINNGTSLQVKRDILPTTDVQPVINGMDVSLGYAVLLNDLTFIPNIYQVIALDVNMDGVISAGDLSQMNQRSIKTILEFKQKWNYNNNGNSNGQLSKDWLFLDESLLNSPAYKISSTYPANDGVGFSRYKVPAVPFCLPVPASVCSSCTAYSEGKLKGVLLGDINGNYDAVAADGQIKREPNAEKGLVYLDLTKAKQSNNYTEVPVYFSSAEKILSLDFYIQLNNDIHYSKIIHPATYLNDALAHSDDDQGLRFTSNSRKNYEADKPVASIRFQTPDRMITENDLQDLTGYLNGELVPFEIRSNQPMRMSNPTEKDKDVLIYPNPASGVLNIEVNENATVQLLDIQGKEVLLEKQANAKERLEIQTSLLKNGMYLLKIINRNFVRTEYVVIEKK